VNTVYVDLCEGYRGRGKLEDARLPTGPKAVMASVSFETVPVGIPVR